MKLGVNGKKCTALARDPTNTHWVDLRIKVHSGSFQVPEWRVMSLVCGSPDPMRKPQPWDRTYRCPDTLPHSQIEEGPRQRPDPCIATRGWGPEQECHTPRKSFSPLVTGTRASQKARTCSSLPHLGPAGFMSAPRPFLQKALTHLPPCPPWSTCPCLSPLRSRPTSQGPSPSPGAQVQRRGAEPVLGSPGLLSLRGPMLLPRAECRSARAAPPAAVASAPAGPAHSAPTWPPCWVPRACGSRVCGPGPVPQGCLSCPLPAVCPPAPQLPALTGQPPSPARLRDCSRITCCSVPFPVGISTL